MTRYGYFLLSYAMLLTGLTGAFCYREGLLQLPLILLYLVWFFLLFISVAFLRWHTPGARVVSVALLALLAVSPVVGARTGVALRNLVFRSRISEYEAAVQAIQAGTEPAIVPRLARHITQRTLPAGDL